MSKSMTMLAFLIAGQFSLAHATNGVKELALLTPADQGRLNDSASEMATSDDSSEMMKGLVADHGSGLHPTLTDDPGEFEIHVQPNHSLVKVDFASVAGQSAPFFVEAIKEEGVAIYGGDGNVRPQAVTSVNGLPATYWFGPQTESTFVLANGAVQIVFPQDVDAASVIAADVIRADLVESPDTHEVKTFNISMLDRNGYMMGEDRLISHERPMFVGILSNAPFRSIIISNTSANWMFSDLNYLTDGRIQEESMLNSSNVKCGTEIPTPPR